MLLPSLLISLLDSSLHRQINSCKGPGGLKLHDRRDLAAGGSRVEHFYKLFDDWMEHQQTIDKCFCWVSNTMLPSSFLPNSLKNRRWSGSKCENLTQKRKKNKNKVAYCAFFFLTIFLVAEFMFACEELQRI